jgi:hypothetical protein
MCAHIRTIKPFGSALRHFKMLYFTLSKTRQKCIDILSSCPFCYTFTNLAGFCPRRNKSKDSLSPSLPPSPLSLSPHLCFCLYFCFYVSLSLFMSLSLYLSVYLFVFYLSVSFFHYTSPNFYNFFLYDSV